MFNLGKIFKPKAGQEGINNINHQETLEEEKISADLDAVKEDEKSLEEEAIVLLEKKQEIADLQEKRLEFYNKAKELEEKMVSLGLSEEKQKSLKDKIMKEGGEISSDIQKIRDEYGFEASPVEVYSLRFKMLDNEANRLKDNLAFKYRKVKEILDRYNYYSLGKTGLDNILNKIDFLQNEFPDVEEVQDSIRKFKDDNDAIYGEMLEELVNKLDKKIDQNTVYKTPGEIKEAEDRLNRVIKLRLKTAEEFELAENNIGRFDKSNN